MLLLQLRAASGLAIPYIGYLELDVLLYDKVIPHCGILVVKDPSCDSWGHMAFLF